MLRHCLQLHKWLLRSTAKHPSKLLWMNTLFSRQPLHGQLLAGLQSWQLGLYRLLPAIMMLQYSLDMSDPASHMQV